jgi:hypothetical protein
MHVDIFINVLPLCNRKAAEVLEMQVEKVAKKKSMKTVAVAKHRLDSCIATHNQRFLVTRVEMF